MKRLICSVILAVAGQIAGCAAVGFPTAQTFNQRVAVAYSGVTAVRLTATDLLVAKKIDYAEAREVQRQSDIARAGIDSAVTVYAASPTEGENRLELSVQLLQALQTFLQTRSTK